jgi:formamidase
VLAPQPIDALPTGICGVDGTAKDECVRTVPPRENGGNTDTRETIIGTTLLFPCFIDGCGLFVGDHEHRSDSAPLALETWMTHSS